MIEIDELRDKQLEFENKRVELLNHYNKLEKERKKFIMLFSKRKLMDMAIDDYVVGKKSKDSFCYWLETRLMELGDIHGSFSPKFGIYYGKRTSYVGHSDLTHKYRFVSKFGNTIEEAFENIKKALLSLLNDAEKDNVEGLMENLLSPMFKGKILSTYFPEKYLNIYSNEYLSYYCDKLKLQYTEDMDEVQKRQILLDLKNQDIIMKEWPIYIFSEFLYDRFGRPVENERQLSRGLESHYNAQKFPDMKKVKPEFIDFGIISETKRDNKTASYKSSKKVDYDILNKSRTRIGDRGEEIAVKAEKEYLKINGRNDLASKVNRLSLVDDTLGYDIMSFELNGKKKYIEVKSTNDSPSDIIHFHLSHNQYGNLKRLNNYYIYVIFSTNSNDPRIWKLHKPLRYLNKGMRLTPIDYMVDITVHRER